MSVERLVYLAFFPIGGAILFLSWSQWGWWAAGVTGAYGILADVQGQMREAAKR